MDGRISVVCGQHSRTRGTGTAVWLAWTVDVYIYELAALGAASCWALNGLIAVGPSREVGAVSFNRARMYMVFVMLGVYVTATGGWATLERDQTLLLLASGFIGIFLGDTAQFLALNRLGPRRTAILFALNAPLAALLGWIFLHEYLSLQTVLGILFCIAGAVMAIAFGKRRSQVHHWESVKGPLWIGLGLGLAAALAQATGSLIARPIMTSGVDPVAASAVRIGVSAIGLSVLITASRRRFPATNRFTAKSLCMTALSGFIGMAVGMTLIMFALSGGKVGVVSTLAATTPALLLPLLWIRTGEGPAPGAWVGAALVVVGCGLIFVK